MRLILPVCPVYGLGALAILLLPEVVRQSPPLLFPAAVLSCTGVEYFTGLFYEKGVSGVLLELFPSASESGRTGVPLFSLLWGVLAVLVLKLIHPWAALLVSVLPAWLMPPVLALWGLDTLLTALVLRRTEDTNALRWYRTPARRKAA